MEWLKKEDNSLLRVLLEANKDPGNIEDSFSEAFSEVEDFDLLRL
jgi:hypothetical protein